MNLRREPDIDALLEQFGSGQVAAAARLITILEKGGSNAEKVLDGIFSRTKDAFRVGFTGPPGAGKSSLLYRITKRFREKDRKKTLSMSDIILS